MLQGGFGLGLNTGVNIGVASNIKAQGAHNMNIGTRQEGVISYNQGMIDGKQYGMAAITKRSGDSPRQSRSRDERHQCQFIRDDPRQ